MDIFKLLARSTNLKNAATASNSSPSTLPSDGARLNPQLFGNDDEDLHQASQKARKRKRGETAAEGPNSIPGELDFFGDKSTRTQGPEVATPGYQGRSSDRITREGEIEGDGSFTSDTEILDEERCRRILKSHKLKITLLSSPEKRKQGRKVDATNTSTDNGKTHTQLSPQPLTSFGQLRSRYKIAGRLAQNIRDQGYNLPTEVQLGSLPLLLESNEVESIRFKKELKRKDDLKGRKKKMQAGIDLLTVAPTGSGKTLSYLIPMLDGLLRERRVLHDLGHDMERGVRSIVIAPTKELANQILNEARKLAAGTGINVAGMRKGMTIMKGTDAGGNGSHNYDHSLGGGGTGDEADSSDDNELEKAEVKKRKIHRGQLVKVHVLISTPLMLLHAITNGESGSTSTLPLVRYLVLDEADVLLDPLFRSQTLGIWGACNNPYLRVSLWSATMGSSIEALAQSTISTRRQSLGLSATKLIRLVVGLKDSAIPNISHRLTYAATEQGKLLAFRQLLHHTASSTDSTPSLRPPFLVFTQTIPRAIALHSELLYDIPAEAGGSSRIAVLHSDLSGAQRDRIMARFRKGEIWVLITTDLLARGIDFRGVNGVVNYDVPNSGAAYVHRVGRTGRAGRDGGVAVTLYTKEDIPYIKSFANIIATSEKLSGKSNNGKEGLQKWLLDMLPTPTKNEKKRLKRHGVEERRASMAERDAKTARKMRISTKSGFDRRIEHNRNWAVRGRRQIGGGRDDGLTVHGVDAGEGHASGGSDSEWGGFDD